MSDLLNKEYITNGTNEIYKELWQNINIDQINTITKPYGGLWCSNKNNDVSDWLTYLKLEMPDYYNITYKNNCIVKFKNNSKLLVLDNNLDFINLKKSNLIIDLSNNPIIINKFYYSYCIDKMPDYEKISNYYDLIYINPYCDISLKQYTVKTMLVINPSCIEYYKTMQLDKKNNIIYTSQNKIINNPNKDYYYYVEYIKKCFDNIDDTNYILYIKKLNELKNNILSNKNYLYNNLGYNINNIDSYKLLYVVLTNICTDLYNKKRKTLTK